MVNAGLVVFAGAFLAGSKRRASLAWAACLVVLGAAVFTLLLFSSIESLPSVFEFNPIRVAKRVWETSDSGAVVKGISVGLPEKATGPEVLDWFMEDLILVERLGLAR